MICVDMPLYSTSVRLEAGHHVRIPIAGNNSSTFAQYPDDGSAMLTVAYSAASPSFLELPVASE